MRTPNSLRSQLVLWTMLPTSAVLVVSAIATYLIASSVANRAFDYSLQDEARTIAMRVHFNGDVPELSLPSDVREVLEYDSLDKDRTVTASSNTLSGSYTVPVVKPDNNYALFNVGAAIDWPGVTGFISGSGTAGKGVV